MTNHAELDGLSPQAHETIPCASVRYRVSSVCRALHVPIHVAANRQKHAIASRCTGMQDNALLTRVHHVLEFMQLSEAAVTTLVLFTFAW